MRLVYRVLAFCCLLSYQASAADDQSRIDIPYNHFSATNTLLPNWRVIGPLRTGYRDSAIDTDVMVRFGSNEHDCALRPSTRECTNVPPELANIVQSDHRGRVDFRWLTNSYTSSRQWESAIYLATNLVADSKLEAWLTLSTLNAGKVWINGELLHSWSKLAIGNRHHGSIHLPLVKGNNYIQVKLAQSTPMLSITTRVESTQVQSIRSIFDGEGSMLGERWIHPGQPLDITLAASSVLEAEIHALSGQKILKKIVESPGKLEVPTLSKGAYYLFLKVGNETKKELFYVGSVEEAIRSFRPQVEMAMQNEDIAIHLSALWKRFESFQKPLENYHAETAIFHPYWLRNNEKRAIDSLGQLIDTLSLLETSPTAYEGMTGFQLRGFRSDIDDQIHHYQLFIPSTARTATPDLPLVVVPATPFSSQKSYIESLFVLTGAEAKNWEEIAEKLGIAVLWPGYRVRPYGNPLDLAHVEEVINVAFRENRIDPTRVYLLGICGGGLTASMLVVRNPTLFAAVAFQDPILHRVKNRHVQKVEYRDFSTYQRWLSDTDPLSQLARIPNLPIWILHGSSNANRGPLSDSVDFYEQSTAAGNDPIFDRLYRSDLSTDLELTNKQLSWFLEHKSSRLMRARPIEDVLSGPISNIFSERTLVIKGTQGSDFEKASADRWYSEYCSAWKRITFGRPCVTVLDVDYDSRIHSDNHLVLIGNAKTNSVWTELVEQLPIRISPDSIEINNQKWTGQSLAIQVWFPIPRGGGQKVVLVGAYDLERAQVGTMELAIDGWFDYGIWRLDGDAAKLHHAGRYM